MSSQLRLCTTKMRSAGNYKVTKMVCVLWLDERRVCMRVCKQSHGCDVKMFCFSWANHPSTKLIWKRFWVEKLTTLLYLPIPLVGWNLENLYKLAVSIFFSHLSWNFKWGKSVFWKASFLQNKNWFWVQDFATSGNFSFNWCHNKELCTFLREDNL